MKALIAFVRPLLLGIALIVLVSAGLLALDDSGRKSKAAIPRVAVVQHVSQAVMDDAVRGYVEGMASQGFVDGNTVSLKFYNAQGDLPTANDIARQVTNGSFDLVLTASTVSVQAVANANKQSKVKHVFGTLTNAAAAGVGVSASDPLDHPPYMTGISTFFPVDKALRLAREINPGLRRIGLVWHSAEINSQLYTADARKTCQELGIELLEADAENSSAVGMAAKSLVARGIDAFLITGDQVVLVATEIMVSVARADRIPVFTIIPPNIRKGTLFDLGANYVEVGHDVGVLAGQVLAGADIAKTPVSNHVPETLSINLNALKGLRGNWHVSPELLARADRWIDDAGEHRKGGALVAPAASAVAPAASR
jgi:putative ABC transport system substrate-binding protein